MNLCGFEIGLDKPFFLIAGPCVIESMQLQLDTAGQLKEITSELGIPFIFKSSFDKANRTSATSFRGPGMEEGLRILSDIVVRPRLGAPDFDRVRTLRANRIRQLKDSLRLIHSSTVGSLTQPAG